MEQTEQKRKELIDMLQGNDTIKPPILGVEFADTGEVYYFTAPTAAQLKIPAILFPYDSREAWEAKAEAGEVLYNRQGRIVITA